MIKTTTYRDEAHNPSITEGKWPTCPAPMVKWSAKDIRHFVNGVSLLPPDGAKQINEFLSKNHTDGKKFVKLKLDDFKMTSINPRWSRTLIDALEIEKKRRVTAKNRSQTVPSTEPSDMISDRGSVSSPSEPDTTVLYEEPIPYGSPPSPRPQLRSDKPSSYEKQESGLSYVTSPTPNQLFFDKQVLNEKIASHTPRSHTLPPSLKELNSEEIDRILRRRLEEERQILIHDFQARLYEQQTRFHQELTLNLQDHNVNFQMDLDETLNSHQMSLTQNLEKEMSMLADKMSKEANKEKVKWVLLQASVDQWKVEMVELRNQLIHHIEEEKEKWQVENNWKSWQVLGSGVGIGAVITLLLFKYTK
ncbi:hypothetical protein K7432_001965 [Basidiobolus ranarum]|uniref:Uncharacterized protein n=1 Tax=Basidiobolus ranarum TaxID=34480 RepID=A0ABR2X280_9FUNG